MSKKVVIPSLIVILVLLLLIIGKLSSSDYPKIPIAGGYLGMTKKKLFKNVPNLERYKEIMDGDGYITADREFTYLIGHDDLSERVYRFSAFTKSFEYEGIKVGMSADEAEKILTSKGYIKQGKQYHYSDGEVYIKLSFHPGVLIDEIIIRLVQEPIDY
jgi:hypothetical protein